MKYVKLAYIGGGSKAWERVFMNDLALSEGISGEIALYDIDLEAAKRNQRIGARINENPAAISKWDYVVYDDLEAALTGADFVACVIKEELGVPRPDRHEITVDASGVNHFTWITQASWQGNDVLKLLPSFMEKYYEKGYCEHKDKEPWQFREDPFSYGNKVKMDLFRRFGVLGAAGDRHLVEFLNKNWYLQSPEAVERWLYHLTTVDYRKADMRKKIRDGEAMANGTMPVKVTRSDEELIRLMKAILGFETVVSNANTLNVGQMPQLPLGCVVETNHVFSENSVKPIAANPLPGTVAALVSQNARNIENTYYGIKNRDLNQIFEAFMAQPLCAELSYADGEALFAQMVGATSAYLTDWYDLSVIILSSN